VGHAVVRLYSGSDEKLVYRAVIVLAGFAIGFIMHRSRLCFARAFREPFMTAEGDMTKAVILALAIGMPIAALLFQKKVIDPYIAIPATFWIGSLVGGVIFGIGMIFAGGCASGSLWRMGEGPRQAVGGHVLLCLERLHRQRAAQKVGPERRG
jgi:uncharacterized membrane protein YedE/YeeE